MPYLIETRFVPTNHKIIGKWWNPFTWKMVKEGYTEWRRNWDMDIRLSQSELGDFVEDQLNGCRWRRGNPPNNGIQPTPESGQTEQSNKAE